MASRLPIDAIASSVASKLSIHEITSSAASDSSVQEDLDMEWESESESESETVLSPSLTNSIEDKSQVLKDSEMESNCSVQKGSESCSAFTMYFTNDWKLLGKKMEVGAVVSYSIGRGGVKSTTMPPIFSNAAFTVSYGSGLYGLPDDGGLDFRMLDYMGEVTDRFCELIKRAPNCTVDFIKAAKHLGVRIDLMHRVKHFLFCNKAIAEPEPNKIRWVFRYPPPEDIQYLRHLRDLEVQRRFEKLVRSLSEEKNGRKMKWRWLFLTEADINDFVGFQNDILMIVHCPRDINLEVPRPAQDADGRQQRKYGIIRKIFPYEGMSSYFVSKLESHDVVNLDETSRSYPAGCSEGFKRSET